MWNSASEMIERHLKRLENEYANKINNNYDYTRNGIDSIKNELRVKRNKKETLKSARLYSILISATSFAFTIGGAWIFLEVNPFVLGFLFSTLTTGAMCFVSNSKIKDLDNECYNLEQIVRNLDSKKSDILKVGRGLEKLKQKIDDLSNTIIFFQKNHQMEVLDNLNLTSLEMFKILENNMSLLSFLYLKHKNLISDGAIEHMKLEDLKKLKLAKGDELDVMLMNNPTAFFKEDTESVIENESTATSKISMNATDTNLTVSEPSTQRRRRYKGYSENQEDESIQHTGSRKR